MSTDPNKLRTSPDIPLNLITTNEIDTRLGKLTFTDGAPSSETIQKILDNYDFVRALQVYMDAHQGASIVPPEELSDEELQGAMDELGIQSMELDEQDYAALQAEPGSAPGEGPEAEGSYLNELERLAALRDQGIISDEEFEAKKQQILGL